MARGATTAERHPFPGSRQSAPMEAKRELTSVDLAALVHELGAYEGAVVDKAYLYGEDLLRLKLRDHDRGRLELLVEVGGTKRIHLADPERVPDAPGRPPEFAMKLRSHIAGGTLAEVSQYEFDRIVRFRFSRPDGDTTLVAELFGDGNVAVLDPTDRVLDCLEIVRLKSRTVVPGAQYEFPASRVNPHRLSGGAFDAHMDDSDTDLVRTLATQLNFGGLYAEELCTRAGVEKTRPISEATDADYAALFAEVEALKADLAAGEFEPRVYYERVGEEPEDGSDRRPVDVTPLPLVEYEDGSKADGLEGEPFETFNAAVDAYFHALEQEATESTGGGGPDVDDRIAKQQRIVDQQESAIERFAEEAEAERAKAESLYANYDIVDEVLTTVREARAEHGWEEIEARLAEGAERGIEAAEAVRGVNPEEGTVTIELEGRDVELDPSAVVEKNADRLYTGAKEIEEKREGAKEALAETRETLAALREQAETADEAAGEGTTEDDGVGEDVDWRSKRSIPVRRGEPWYDRFRWFHTTDGFLVLGGRNADQNEELVKKYLEGGDRFFHSQAHGAPATVLKATGPSESARDVDFPESTLEQAAQFAISYSSVWKDGHYSGDVYMVGPDQVSKTPESGEYLAKGSFAIRGDRTYFDDTPVGAAVGIACEPETRVVGGPPAAVRRHAETWIEVEPGRYAQGDVAKRIYREFRERFADTTFVRKVASPDEIAKFLPPGGSRIVAD